jgi:hypothetical protein
MAILVFCCGCLPQASGYSGVSVVVFVFLGMPAAAGHLLEARF